MQVQGQYLHLNTLALASSRETVFCSFIRGEDAEEDAEVDAEDKVSDDRSYTVF